MLALAVLKSVEIIGEAAPKVMTDEESRARIREAVAEFASVRAKGTLAWAPP